MGDLLKKLFKGKAKVAEPDPPKPRDMSSGNRQRRDSEPLQVFQRPTGDPNGPYYRDPNFRNRPGRVLAPSSNRRPDIDPHNPPPAPLRAPVWTDKLRGGDFKNVYDGDERSGKDGYRGAYGQNGRGGGNGAIDDAEDVYELTAAEKGEFQREQERNKAAGKETFATALHRIEKEKKISYTKKDLAKFQRDNEALKREGKKTHATQIFGTSALKHASEDEEDADTEGTEALEAQEPAQRGLEEEDDAEEPKKKKKGDKDKKDKKGKKDKKDKKGKKAKEVEAEGEEATEEEPQSPPSGSVSPGNSVTTIKNEASILRKRASSASERDRDASLDGEEAEQGSRSMPATGKPVSQRPRSSSASAVGTGTGLMQRTRAGKRQPSARSKQIFPDDEAEDNLNDVVQASLSSRASKAASRKEEAPQNVSELSKAISESLDAVVAESLQKEADQEDEQIRSDMQAALMAQTAESENLKRRSAAFGTSGKAQSVPVKERSMPAPSAPGGYGRRQTAMGPTGESQTYTSSNSKFPQEDIESTSRFLTSIGRRQNSATSAGTLPNHTTLKANSSVQVQEDLESTSKVLSSIGRRASSASPTVPSQSTSTSSAKKSVTERASQIDAQASSTSLSQSSRPATLMNRGFADMRRTRLEAVRPMNEISEDEEEEVEDVEDGNASDESGASSASQAQSIMHRGFANNARSVLEGVRPVTERRKTIGGSGRR